MSRYTALLLAGSRPGGDPFARSLGAAHKALIPVAGEPMILRPLRALLASPAVAEVRVLTEQAAALQPFIPADPRVRIEPSGATIAATLEAIAADPATRWPLLVTTADHALLDPAMIAEFVARASGTDLAIGMVERRSLMRRLPQTQRTWLRFRGGAYSGANLFALSSPAVSGALRLWRSVEQDRKRGWRLFAALGPGAMLGAGLRLRTLDKTLAAMSRRLGMTIAAIELGNPLAAVDVDKPADLALVEAIVAGRA